MTWQFYNSDGSQKQRQQTVPNINDLGDVVVASPTATQSLRYDGANWVNSAPLINDSSDVVLAAPASGDSLRYNGTNWVDDTTVQQGTLAARPLATAVFPGTCYYAIDYDLNGRLFRSNGSTWAFIEGQAQNPYNNLPWTGNNYVNQGGTLTSGGANVVSIAAMNGMIAGTFVAPGTSTVSVPTNATYYIYYNLIRSSGTPTSAAYSATTSTVHPGSDYVLLGQTTVSAGTPGAFIQGPKGFIVGGDEQAAGHTPIVSTYVSGALAVNGNSTSMASVTVLGDNLTTMMLHFYSPSVFVNTSATTGNFLVRLWDGAVGGSSVQLSEKYSPGTGLPTGEVAMSVRIPAFLGTKTFNVAFTNTTLSAGAVIVGNAATGNPMYLRATWI